MNLAYRFPLIFWNCANLIVDSGGDESIEDKGTDYEKVAIALNRLIKNTDTKVSLIDINKSEMTFVPDLENSTILFGLRSLNRVGPNIIKEIIKNRPYKSIKDFINRCNLNITSMISLIKSGAFDKLVEKEAKERKVNPRIYTMVYFLSIVSKPKKKLTLQNFNGLVQYNLIPDDLELQKRLFYFNKELKKLNYKMPVKNSILKFFEELNILEQINIDNNIIKVDEKIWNRLYEQYMNNVRDWLKDNQKEILDKVNNILFLEFWDKYASNSIPAWEMEAMCFYYSGHELDNVNYIKYGISDYFKLNPESEIETYFKKGGRDIPIFKLFKIIGTVIAKKKEKGLVTILTTTGVVNVKFNKEYFDMFNQQISERQENGTKKIIEKTWFQRGNKIMITGYRKGDLFMAKTYKSTLTHQLYKINEVLPNGDISITHTRAIGIQEEDSEND